MFWISQNFGLEPSHLAPGNRVVSLCSPPTTWRIAGSMLSRSARWHLYRQPSDWTQAEAAKPSVLPLILPATPIVEDVFRHHRQSQDVLQFPVGLQACAVRNLRTMKLQLQTSVETDAQHVLFHFTHWISCCLLPSPWEHPLFIGLNNTSGSNNNLIKWKIRGHLNRLPISRQPIFLELTKFSIVEFSTTPPKKKAHSRTLSNSRSSRNPILTTFCKFEENKTT